MPLPDLKTEDSVVVEKLLDRVHKLVPDCGADGFRIDMVKHLRKDFWSEAAGVSSLAEVLINDTNYAAQYTGE